MPPKRTVRHLSLPLPRNRRGPFHQLFISIQDQKSNAKKRAAPSDSISNKAGDASNSPNKEKPSKRPRTSTITASDVSGLSPCRSRVRRVINAFNPAKGASVTASTSDDEEDNVEAAPAPSSKSAAKVSAVYIHLHTSALTPPLSPSLRPKRLFRPSLLALSTSTA